MADGILDHVENRIALMKKRVYQITKPSPVLPFPKVKDPDTSNLDQSSIDLLPKSEWILSLFEKSGLNTASQNMAKKGSVIEVIGQKANLKEEKKLDKLYIKFMAAQFIQKFYRGHMARKRVHLIRMTLSAIILQKYARRWLSKRELGFLRERKAATTIQTKIRTIFAKRELHKLRKEFVLDAI